MRYALATVSVLALTPTAALAATWEVDPAHATARFTVRHMMVTDVHGELSDLKGTVAIDEKDITRSKVEVSMDAASIDTRNAKRDEHLESPDFLDAAKHPKITFTSTKVSKAGKDALEVVGNLTIRGVTKPVTLAVKGPTKALKNPWGQTVRGVHATTTISRKDFGLTWNKALETGGVLVGDEVRITLDLELIAKQGEPS